MSIVDETILQNLLIAMIHRMMFDCARNAKKRGIRFEITRDYILQMAERQRWRCAVTGLPFDLRRVGPSLRRPFAPSIDRLDSALGYTRRNVRLVCVAANYAMNEWGEPVLRKMALALVCRMEAETRDEVERRRAKQLRRELRKKKDCEGSPIATP